MKNRIYFGGFARAAAVVILVSAFAAAAWAQQATPQDTPADPKKLLQEIAGDYNFDFQGQPMTINFFEKDGKLYGGPVGETPEEMLPVEGSLLKFTVTPAAAGQTYELEFARNDKKVIDRCVIKVMGMEILGTKTIK
jgi:hypothetical protein